MLIFSPKNQQVNKSNVMKQVRNNLKDLLEDIENKPKGGILSPKNQKFLFANRTSMSI
jgi:hypothetical protein